MKRFVLALAAMVALPFVAATATADDAGAAPALPACVAVNTDSRYVPYGYNHIVIVKNGCSKAATCAVSTDVNPSVQSVDVASSATAEVITFSGSPSQKFVAKVTCRLK